jgi:hypothetical protein
MDMLHYLITGSFDASNVSRLEEIIHTNSVNFTIGSSIFLLLLVAVAYFAKKPSELVKVLLFSFMVLIISINTLYLAGSTIYKNQRSLSKGPVHWHADLEIWNCGQEVNLRDPKGWSNKIGSPLVHEHNDKKIHVEGVILHTDDASLGHFFDVIDGKLNSRELVVPVNEGHLNLKNGDVCNGAPGMVQVFVYQTNGTEVTQKKLAVNPETHMLAADSAVPAGDCIIVEFDSMIKEKTERICQSYKVAEFLNKVTIK